MEDAMDLLISIRDCFVRHPDNDWWQHKTNDREWVDVSEDLNDYLNQAQEIIDEVGE